MEGLTQKVNSCVMACRMENKTECAYFSGNCKLKCKDAQMYDKLAAYEDTGLTPAEVAKFVHEGLPAALDKLAVYESTGLQPDRCRGFADAVVDGRLVVLPSCAKEGDPKPPCFHMETGSPWCLGLAHGDDDYPISNCQKCWYSEYAAADREEAEAALSAQEK